MDSGCRAEQLQFRVPQFVRLRNLTLRGNLGRSIDLARLASEDGSFSYNRSAFPGVVCRSACTLTFFESGCVIVSGARDIPRFRSALSRLESVTGLHLTAVRWIVQNSTITMSLRPGAFEFVKLNLPCEYDPETCPNIVVRFESPSRCTAVVGPSGHCYATGFQSVGQVRTFVAKLSAMGLLLRPTRGCG